MFIRPGLACELGCSLGRPHGYTPAAQNKHSNQVSAYVCETAALTPQCVPPKPRLSFNLRATRAISFLCLEHTHNIHFNIYEMAARMEGLFPLLSTAKLDVLPALEVGAISRAPRHVRHHTSYLEGAAPRLGWPAQRSGASESSFGQILIS